MSEAAGWGNVFGATGPMQLYDEILVPRLFDPLAQLLLDEVGVQSDERVLDVACGPGTVALAAARRVGSAGSVVGCDISRAMLDLARGKSSSITWVETAAAPLAGIDDAAFDVVTCQQGLQFFPDRPAAAGEMRRALVPGGRVGIAVWAAIEQSPAFAAVADAIAQVLGDEPADRYRNGPWGMPDPEALRALLVDAGFLDVQVVQREIRMAFDNAAPLVQVLHISPVAADVAALDDEQRAALAAAVDESTLRSSMVSNVAVARR